MLSLSDTFKTLKAILSEIWVQIVLALFILAFIKLIYIYSSFRTDVAFLAQKQSYLDNSIWRTAFYIHVFSSVVALIAGLTQFSLLILVQYKTLHKLMGYIYFIIVVFINFPTAMILALNANGGTVSRTAFFLLDSLWLIFTITSVYWIKLGNIQKHNEFALRSYALSLSAITLRLWTFILTLVTTLNVDDRYKMVSWLGFIPNLIIMELYIRRRLTFKNTHLSK